MNIKDNIVNENIKEKKEETSKIDSNKMNQDRKSNIIENNNRNNNLFLHIKNNIKNLNEKNISNEYQNKIPYKDEQIKIKNKINEDNKEKNNEIENNKKINNNIIDKKNENENRNNKNNFIKIKKAFINNIIHRNILTDRTITNTNNNNKKIKLQNLIPKCFKYINPKQHLINEEYKTLLKKESNTCNTNKEKENIIEKYLKYIIDKNKSDSKSKKNFKAIEKDNEEKDKSKTNKTLVTISNSNLNIKKDNNLDINNNINMKCKTQNQNQTMLESIKIARKNNKSLSTVNNNNLYFQEVDSKKIKDNFNMPSHLFLKLKKSSNSNISINKRKNIHSKISKMLRTNKEILDNTLSNTLINNNSKKNNNNQNPKNVNVNHTQIKDKSLLLNKSTKNKVIVKRNRKNIFDNKDITKNSYYINKYNENTQNNIFEKTMRTFENESGSKSKRIAEMRNGLNKMFNNFLGQKKNILNTNYIINKRCRMINNRNKKKMSINLSRYFMDCSQKKNKSQKYNLEINVSNNNYDNLNLKDNKISTNQKVIYNKTNNNNNNNNILSNNSTNKKYILLNSKKQPNLHRYNTNIRSLRFLNSNSSYPKTTKKIISNNKSQSNKKINHSSLKKRKCIISKPRDINNNINISNSLLSNNDKTIPINDYCLKILDQYYTINNTINITNNNSLISNFSNNMSNKKTDTNDKINNLKNKIRDIFKYFNKEKRGFIILNNNFKINIIKNNSDINFEFIKILEKMMKTLYEINKKDNSIDFEENIIINENNFIKYMIYIYTNLLNIYEKKIFYSSNINDINKKIKKDFMPYNFNPKSSFNKFNDNKNILNSYYSTSKINNKREKKINGNNDINKFIFYKIKKNENKKKLKFNSFNDM